jgi:hypothetical protein
LDLEHAEVLVFPNLRFECHGRRAMDFCCALNHVKFFLDPAACHFTAVSDADEQTAALGVGEGAEGFGNLVGVVHAQLEVLVLVLALFNHAQDVRHEVKVARKP